MSNDFIDAESAYELLEELRVAMSDAVERETRLTRAVRLKRVTLEKNFEDSIAETDATLETNLHEAEHDFEEAQQHIASRFRWRELRIEEAHKRSQDRIQEVVEERVGSQKFNIQKGTLDAQRQRKASLKKADEYFEGFKKQLESLGAEYEACVKKAKKVFRAFPPFMKLFSGAREQVKESDLAVEDAEEMMGNLREQLVLAEAGLKRIAKDPLAVFFRFIPVAFVLMINILIHVAAAAAIYYLQKAPLLYGAVGGSLVISCGVIAFLYLKARKRAKPVAVEVVQAMEKARVLHSVCAERSAKGYESERKRVEKESEETIGNLQRGWDPKADQKSEATLKQCARELDQQAERLQTKNAQIHKEKLDRVEPDYHEKLERLRTVAATRKAGLSETYEAEVTKLDTDVAAEWERLIEDWSGPVTEVYQRLATLRNTSDPFFPDWVPARWESWSPPPEFLHAVKFGESKVDLEKLVGNLPQDKRLPMPGPAELELPLLATMPKHGSVLFEAENSRSAAVIGSLNNIILRLLTTSPPGRLSFTVFDPVGLGENFAGVMHLADYEEHLINSRIWTQSDQIEQRLGELNEHMEKVIQMYLRNEYESITDYNRKAGTIAEKYHFLVVADFPSGFSEVAAKRLLSIATSGARCGVYTLIHWDRKRDLPQEFVPQEMRESGVWVKVDRNVPTVGDTFPEGIKMSLDEPPAPEFAVDLVQKIGQASVDSNRVEVPFDQVTPSDEELWSHDTTSELRVAIGRSGATKLQYLAMGKGTKQHALLAGKTGSGKSTLFHVMITNLALWADPEHVEFYLVDFKKGVEFKAYATKQLPHARVIAIESDREFGLSVLERLDEELKRRGDLFRELGVQDLAGYKRAGGGEAIPRTLLLIDEFQELFVEDDRVAQNAALLLDRIVRQGRAFGIHAILGSQTLGGAFTLARTTLGQMVIRIALQCNEADAYLIMDDNNPAPRMLTRPGEGIYNDQAGMLEGNSPFQVVWLSDEQRDAALDRVHELAEASDKNWPRPIVFEGNAPAEIRENGVLQKMLEAEVLDVPATGAQAFLGAPNSIKGPTEAVFRRQAGNHLLVVGQREEAALAILTVSLVSLAAQFPRGSARFFVLDGSAPGSAQREHVEMMTGLLASDDVRLVKNNEIEDLMAELDRDLTERTEGDGGESAPRIFLLVNGLQKFKKLKHEDDFSFSMDDSAEKSVDPGAAFNHLLSEGAAAGIHVMAVVDTYNNVNRYLSRKALTEFEMRVLFQMSANDSASLIDSPKAGNLGLHRALFYNEQEGYLETFRPYRLPKERWLSDASTQLARLRGDDPVAV